MDFSTILVILLGLVVLWGVALVVFWLLQPGFVFEPADRLGESLVLIGDLEHRRAELERRFPLLPNLRTPKTDDRKTPA